MAGATLSAQGFNEGKGKPYTPEDVRFRQSKDGRTVDAIVLGWPDKAVTLGVLAKNDAKVKDVKLLGAKDTTSWKQDESGLVIQPPGTRGQPGFAAVYEVTLGSD